MTLTLLEVLERAETGEYRSVKDWDYRVIPSKTEEVLKEHGLEKTCDPSNPINDDDGLANKFYEAGIDFAARTGVLCMDAERIIRFSQEELRTALRDAARPVSFGEGRERITVAHRRPEQNLPMMNLHGCWSPTSEELAVTILSSIVANQTVDLSGMNAPLSYCGREVKGRTPIDYFLGASVMRVCREASARVGRPGLGMIVFGPCGTEFGNYGMAFESRPSDVSCQPFASELKVDRSILFRIANAVHLGQEMCCFHHPMLGGYVGGPEGSALMRVSSSILMVALSQCTMTQSQVTDVRYGSGTGSLSVWANSVACQALANNTGHIIVGCDSPVSGPCTEMVLYESAVSVLTESTSGASLIFGVRSGGGRWTNGCTGLESRFAGELGRAASTRGYRRGDANEVVKGLLAKYERNLPKPPAGKTFLECYDGRALRPSVEWQGIYDKVRRELVDRGVPLE